MTPEMSWLLHNGTVEPLEPYNAEHISGSRLQACGQIEVDEPVEEKTTIDGLATITTTTYATCSCPEEITVRVEYRGSLKDIARAVRRETNAQRLASGS